MKIFILEDNPIRQRRFRTELSGHIITMAESITEAYALWKPPYDVVFLDNDLGGKTMCDEFEWNSGWTFAKEKQQELRKTFVICHSLNSLMREKISNHVGALAAPFIQINWESIRSLADA